MQRTSARLILGVFAFFFLQVFTRFEDCSLTSNYWRTGVGVKDKREPSILQPSTAWNRKESPGNALGVQNGEGEALKGV